MQDLAFTGSVITTQQFSTLIQYRLSIYCLMAEPDIWMVDFSGEANFGWVERIIFREVDAMSECPPSYGESGGPSMRPLQWNKSSGSGNWFSSAFGWRVVS